MIVERLIFITFMLMCEKRLKVNLYFKKKNLFLLNFFYKIKQDKKLGILYQTNIKLWKKKFSP